MRQPILAQSRRQSLNVGLGQADSPDSVCSPINFHLLGPVSGDERFPAYAKFASLSGTVTDLFGKPLPGFLLWLRGIGTSAQSPLAVQVDGAGRFRLEELRAGKIVLETRSCSFAL